VNEASTLIQEAAHEDANIIFGAVIDESMPEGEMRVTVIATGLDGSRMRCNHDGDAARTEQRGSVTPLRLEPVPLDDRLPAAEQRTEPVAAGRTDAAVGVRPSEASDWMSPFDDELDVPTFIRRGGHRDEDEEIEEPAFLRRSAD
jgi:cell division protein FtsZ